MTDHSVFANLEPQNVLRCFEELCRIPHGSGNTAAASDWVARFAQERGLRCRRDEAGNVVVWKDATPGYEDHPAVMLQGHLDMVCAADPGVEHDFTKDGLELTVDGDWIKARGTTLGGDDGVAVAMMMAVLDDGSLPHPPLEAVFTVDEEIGLLGATALDCSDLRSRYLINIDSEAEGVLTVGCAGGARCDIIKEMPRAKKPKKGEFWTSKDGCYCDIYVEGLSGGHSGAEIHKGRANAIKLLAECLLELGCPHFGTLEGGEQDNAIPQSAWAAIVARNEREAAVLRARAEAWAEKKKADCPMDPGFTLRWETHNTAPYPYITMRRAVGRDIVWLLLDAPNGVLAMNPDLPDQVQTSLNLGVVRVGGGDDSYRLTFCIRSSVAEEKEQMVRQLQALADANGATLTRRGDYPAWEYRKDSPLRDTMVAVFKERYGREPKVETIHAGLECGILTSKMPELDAVSFGPDLEDIHTPRERLSAASLQRTWGYLTAVLARL